jgi:putative alpha-1,2-mannosidase
VFNAIGLYTYSPADPEYIISVPLFDKIRFSLNSNVYFTISKQGVGKRITNITYGGEKIERWFITHNQLKEGKELKIFLSEK